MRGLRTFVLGSGIANPWYTWRKAEPEGESKARGQRFSFHYSLSVPHRVAVRAEVALWVRGHFLWQ